jgi:hypothetical protein
MNRRTNLKKITDSLKHHYPNIVDPERQRITKKYLKANNFRDKEEYHEYLDKIYKYDKNKKYTNTFLNSINPKLPLKNQLHKIYDKQSGRIEIKKVKQITKNIFKKVIKDNTLYNVVLRVFIKDRTKRWYGYDIGSQSKIWANFDAGMFFIQDTILTYVSANVEVPDERWRDLKNAIKNNQIKFEIDKKGNFIFADYIQRMLIDDELTQKELQHFHSSLLFMTIISKEENNSTSNFKNFKHTRVRDVAERYFPNKFIVHEIRDNAESFRDLFIDTEVYEEVAHLKQSCFPKAILFRYKTSYDKYNKVPLSFKTIVETCLDTNYEDGEVEMTIEQGAKWFKHMDLGLEIFDVNNQLLYSYYPQKYHWAIRPRIMRVIYHNEHLELITELNSFEKSCHKISNKVSSKYSLPEPRKYVADDYTITNNYNEVIDAITNKLKVSDVNLINIIYNDKCNDLLKELLNNGITPYITTKSGITVTGLLIKNLKLGERNITIYIQSAIDIQGFTQHRIKNVDEYVKYKFYDTLFQSTVINKYHLSEFTPQVEEVFNKCNITICAGATIDGNDNIPLNEICNIDFKKFYATSLRDLPYIPVISPFDNFLKCEPSYKAINDELYIVQINELNFIYNKRYTLMYGWEYLKVMNNINCSLFAKIKLITCDIKTVKESLNHLFSKAIDEVDETLIKGIVNKSIGKTGKKMNRKRETICFKNEDDALRYIYNTKKGARFQFDEGIWIVNSIFENKLEHGFRPINEAVLGMSRLRLFELSNKFNKNDIIGYKTDAIFLKYDYETVEKLAFLQPMLKDKMLGGIRIESNKMPPTYKIEFIQNESDFKKINYPKPIPLLTQKDILTYIKPNINEYDKIEIRKLFKNKTISLADPGVGKSYSTFDYVKSKYTNREILVVAPYNSICRSVLNDYGLTCITFNCFKGENIKEVSKIKPYSLDGVKCIVFEEIMLLQYRRLIKIQHFMLKHPDIEYLATGDHTQLEAIDDVINNERRLEYVLKLFPNKVTLLENKRLNNEEDKTILKNIKKDLFVNEISVRDVVLKYFKNKILHSLEEIKTLNITNGFTYKDSSSKTLNEFMHSYFRHSKHMYTHAKTLENGIKYHIHGELICKTNFKVKGYKLYSNFRYRIININRSRFELEDILDGTKVDVSIENIIKNFSLPYSSTVHSVQGGKVINKFVIADCNEDYVDKNWLYTAITRAVDFNDIYFLDYDEIKEINKISVAKDMVTRYKIQDAQAKRHIDESLYVDYPWILNQYKLCHGRCRIPNCNRYMSFEKNAEHKVTVNRINNLISHHKSNCELLCLKCNKTLK